MQLEGGTHQNLKQKTGLKTKVLEELNAELETHRVFGNVVVLAVI
jgi:hypothetical protein